MAQVGRRWTAAWTRAHEKGDLSADSRRDRKNSALVQRTQGHNTRNLAWWNRNNLKNLFDIASRNFWQAWNGRQSRASFKCVYGERVRSCR